MSSICFTIDGPPVPKQRPRMTRSGHVYTPAKTRAYEKLVAIAAQDAVAREQWIADVAKYSVHITIRRARKVADIDNYAKSILDGMNKIIYPDDKYINTLSVNFVEGGMQIGALVYILKEVT